MNVFTVREVTEILKLSKKTVLGLIKSGRLQAVKVGREWRISEIAIRRLLNADEPAKMAEVVQ